MSKIFINNSVEKNNCVVKKINTETDDYFLNPYKFKYNGNNYNDLNFESGLLLFNSSNSNDLDLIIKTLTSIVMSNSTSYPDKNNVGRDNKNIYELKSNNNLDFEKISKNVNIINSDNEKDNFSQHSNVFKLVANNKFDELEKFVTNNKSSINIQDNDGDTPLHIAVFLGNIRACEVLINAGANIYIKDKWGQTSLHRICFCLDKQNILKIVNIFYKINKNNHNDSIFNQIDCFGNTPFHLILKYIIKNKIKLNKIHMKLIEKLKVLTNTELKNKEGFSVKDLLLSI